MDIRTLDHFRCPKSGSKLILQDSIEGRNGRIESGKLLSESCGAEYIIHNYIPRFVPESNYADNFGLQWNRFSKTQLDSFSGIPISSSRFWKATGWQPQSLKDRWVLDIGCGSGRFAEIALEAGAHVIALDYSTAVDACWDNLRHHERLYVVQGDIFSLPFKKGTFDYIYCFGVMQHTPNVEAAFKSIPYFCSVGGRVAVDFYWRRLRTMLHVKYLLRPFTSRLEQEKLFYIIERWVPYMLRLSNFFRVVPFFGRILQRLVPVANYHGIYPLNNIQHKEWSLLDTFDMLSPKYDSPQSKKTINRWMNEAGFSEIEVLHATLLVARGIKSQ